MTSSHSNENLDISLNILDPNLIVLPIPDRKTNASTSTEICLRINNPTTRTFRLSEDFLIPELRQRDGQAFPLQKGDSQASNNPYQDFSIPPQCPCFFTLTAEFSWHDDSLQLLITIPSEHWTEYFHRWVFSQLQLGTYSLRLTHSSPTEEFLGFDANRVNPNRVEDFQTEFLVSDWITLQLVEPLGNAVEVDGICFAIFIQEPIITICQEEQEKLVQWGARISNRTCILYRFDLQQFRPEFLAPDGRWIQVGVNRNKSLEVKDSDIPLIEPGESVNFLMDVKLVWGNRRERTKCIRLVGKADYGGVWATEVSRGSYQVRLIYKNPFSEKEMQLFSTGKKTQVSQFWVGKIVTPFVGLFFQ